MKIQHRVEIQRKQMAALDRISRSRALTDWESAELERLHYAALRRSYIQRASERTAA